MEIYFLFSGTVFLFQKLCLFLIMILVSGFPGHVSIRIGSSRIFNIFLQIKWRWILFQIMLQAIQILYKLSGNFRVMLFYIHKILMQTNGTFFHHLPFFWVLQTVIFIILNFRSLHGTDQLTIPVHMLRRIVRKHKVSGKFMVDHRSQPQNFSFFITNERNILIVIILIAFQHGNQDLHGKLLCHVFMSLKIGSLQNIRIIIKHHTVILILVYIHLFIRILPKEFQKIQKLLIFIINPWNHSPIIIVFLCLFFITMAKSQLI